MIIVSGALCVAGIPAGVPTPAHQAKHELAGLRKSPHRLKNLALLSQIEVSDLHPAVKLDNRYAALLERRMWEEKLIKAELRVLWETVLDSAARNNGALPDKLDCLSPSTDVVLADYGYFPVSRTNSLDNAGVLFFCRRLLTVDGENVVYVEKGDTLLRMSLEAFERLRETDVEVRLAREMRRMVPQIFALSGEGKVLRLTKESYSDAITNANKTRTALGSPQIPREPFEYAFRNVDEDIYRYMQQKGPTTDKNGQQLSL